LFSFHKRSPGEKTPLLSIDETFGFHRFKRTWLYYFHYRNWFLSETASFDFNRQIHLKILILNFHHKVILKKNTNRRYVHLVKFFWY